jgi:hypothetical protein
LPVATEVYRLLACHGPAREPMDLLAIPEPPIVLPP